MTRSFFLQNAAYVPQEDRLWSALTGDNYRRRARRQGSEPIFAELYTNSESKRRVEESNLNALLRPIVGSGRSA